MRIPLILAFGFVLAPLIGAAPSGKTAASLVGDETCLGCHQEIAPLLGRTSHQAIRDVHCESCHGPGSIHADSPEPANIRGLKGSASQEILSVCSTCHKGMTAQGSSHLRNGRACLECHDMGHASSSPRSAASPVRLLRDRSAEGCFRCHNIVRADFSKPYRHSPKGLANVCTSCHDPHRSSREVSRGRDIDNRCRTCHAAVTGPFAYPHLGTRRNGCRECHAPHGSPNPNLLVRSSVRFLCLSCHTGLPGFHDLASPRYQNCTSCHRSIHGSNTNPRFLD